MKIKSNGSTCTLHNFRRSQSNAALINTEVCQEPQASGCLQTNPAGVSCREGCFERFPVPATVSPCAGRSTVHWNKESESKYLLHVRLQVFSTFLIWHVISTQDQRQLMLVFLAVNLGTKIQHIFFTEASLDANLGQCRRGGRKADCWEHPILVSYIIPKDRQSSMKGVFYSPISSNATIFRSKT